MLFAFEVIWNASFDFLVGALFAFIAIFRLVHILRSHK